MTDFEEFAVYDCRVRPYENDKAAVARVLYLTFEDYAERWDEIYGGFSREAVLRGAFDRLAASSTRKRGTAEVDEAFLLEVAAWRELLAKSVARNNPQLGERELNFVVQRTIDRIIFLRICEDRKIEPANRLREAADGAGVYERLCGLFKVADDRYNSGLFHFRSEATRNEPPDTLTLGVTIEDAPLRQILRSMYYPESPYEFSVLPPEILGHVYEQLLGSVIRLSPSHRVQIEEKPLVRKAGGVYYTPKHVVDFIVRRTVGARLQDQFPGAQINRLRIVDTSCGSGSFLIAAYQYLLDWYRDRYVDAGPERHSKVLYQVGPKDWRLTTPERKRILLTHIFGVDIDAQAVEVTKLSLLLKVLEGETEQSISRQLQLLHLRALPDLGTNIKCGNSLIAPSDVGHSLFPDPLLMERINPFDWNAEFPEIMAGGGFDCVVGNPPYIRIQTLNEVAPEEAALYRRLYRAAASGNYDIYVAFVEKGLSLLLPKGRLGFIVPSKFFTTDYGKALRTLLSESGLTQEVVDFGHEQLFSNATTYTCLVFASPTPSTSVLYAKTESVTLPLGVPRYRVIPAKELTAAPWTFRSEQGSSVEAKLRRGTVALLSVPTAISRGSSTGDDTTFMLKRVGSKLLTLDGKEVSIEPDLLRVPITSSAFGRFKFKPEPNAAIMFPYRPVDGAFELIAELELKQKYPNSYAYLKSRKKQLTNRAGYREWWAYSAPRNLELHDRAQLLIPLLADRGSVGEIVPPNDQYCLMASAGFSLTVSMERTVIAHRYLLGLLNSSLLFWQLRHISNKFRGNYITCTKQYVGTLPIRLLDLSIKEEKETHDRIVRLVDKLVDLSADLSIAAIASRQEFLRRQIASAEQELDGEVFRLYELSPEEEALVRAELSIALGSAPLLPDESELLEEEDGSDAAPVPARRVKLAPRPRKT